MPYHVSIKTAEKFVESKKDWILKQQSKILSYEQEIKNVQQNTEEIDVEAASKHLNERLNYLAEKFDLKFNRITFRRQKTRWGSCSAKNNLSLNIKLYKLPQELQDYVILHELIHTRIKNHSSYFWKELERILPKARVLNKELRKYQILAL